MVFPGYRVKSIFGFIWLGLRLFDSNRTVLLFSIMAIQTFIDLFKINNDHRNLKIVP